jgi:hypothetical protein
LWAPVLFNVTIASYRFVGISPHTIYFGKPPFTSYSAMLGPSYKVAKTEYWQVMLQVKNIEPNKVIDAELVECLSPQVMVFG